MVPPTLSEASQDIVLYLGAAACTHAFPIPRGGGVPFLTSLSSPQMSAGGVILVVHLEQISLIQFSPVCSLSLMSCHQWWNLRPSTG